MLDAEARLAHDLVLAQLQLVAARLHDGVARLRKRAASSKHLLADIVTRRNWLKSGQKTQSRDSKRGRGRRRHARPAPCTANGGQEAVKEGTVAEFASLSRTCPRLRRVLGRPEHVEVRAALEQRLVWRLSAAEHLRALFTARVRHICGRARARSHTCCGSG
eukprot:1835309-Pleurochrysis_carterae.AAC.2